MPVYAWGALGFLIVSLIGSAAVTAVRGLRAWRTFRSVSRRTTDALETVAATGAAVERRAGALAAGSDRLTAAVARLQRSLAELAALRAAAAEAQALVGGVRGVVPRK